MQLAKAALFPLDEQLEIGGVVWSQGVMRDAMWLNGDIPSYEMVEEILRRISSRLSSLWLEIELRPQRSLEHSCSWISEQG